jgi:hypothetical protein
LPGEPVWKRTLLDLAAALFLIGGVVSLVSLIAMIPIATIYPFFLMAPVRFITVVVLIVGTICAVEAFECYGFASKRDLSKAGIRGIIIGAVLLSLSMGLIGVEDFRNQLITASAILIIVAGAVCYVYRE